jgi:glycosyltransferase involved in cell wall biosynthesis
VTQTTQSAPSPVPRVSVITPAYNADSTIVDAVSSALRQTIADLEVIIVDDGSIHPVGDTLSSLRDDRLRIIRMPRNRGVGAARNTALRAARAPLVAQLDADDLWRESHLEDLLPAFADPRVGLAYTNAEVIGHPHGLDRWIADRTPDDGLPAWISDTGAHPVNDLGALYQANPVPSPAVIVRTDAARAVGGYPEWVSVGEDYLLYIRIRRAGWLFAYVDTRSAVYRWPEPGRGATFNLRRNARQEAKLFAVLAFESPRDPAIRKRLLRELADVVATHVPAAAPLWRVVRRLRPSSSR